MKENIDVPSGGQQSIRQNVTANESFLMFMVGFMLFVFKLCKP